MSYRLIDANALAMSCAEVNDLPCIYADLPNGLDGGHYDMAQGSADKSRWFELFGTPERATRTAYDMHECSLGVPIECDDCAAKPICASGAKNYDALLEWLKSEVRDD